MIKIPVTLQCDECGKETPGSFNLKKIGLPPASLFGLPIPFDSYAEIRSPADWLTFGVYGPEVLVCSAPCRDAWIAKNKERIDRAVGVERTTEAGVSK